MITMTMRRLAVALALALASISPAMAQQPARPVTSVDDNTMLTGLGLTFMNVNESTGIGFGANALFKALSSSDRGNLGIAADFGVNDFEGGTLFSVMGGPRYTFKTTGKAVPYAQFLVGIVHCCDDTDFVPGLGFGVDVAFRPRMNFRGELSFIFDDSTASRFFFGISVPMRR